MNDRLNDGGPAFPHSSQPLDAQGNPMCGEHSEWGMSLRDWLAGKALVGLLSCPSLRAQPESIETHLALWAYKYADAMLTARKEKP